MLKLVRLLVAFIVLAVAAAMCQAIGGIMYWCSLVLILMAVPIGVTFLKNLIQARL